MYDSTPYIFFIQLGKELMCAIILLYNWLNSDDYTYNNYDIQILDLFFVI
jgi:hypothetical protein